MIRRFCAYARVAGIPALVLSHALTGCAPPGQEHLKVGSAASSDLVEEIRTADQEEVRAILHGDREVQQRIWAEDFVVTSAGGQVLRRADVIQALEAGALPYQAFDRDTEEVRDYGSVAVSMGREWVLPVGLEGAGPVIRRFTHLWVQRDGAWRLSVRHAGVVPDEG